jgi:glycosyltransferase involved in cell wall biosynthesis
MQRVSVIINAYTAGRFDDLIEAIGAVGAQTHHAVELIVVIDGDPLLAESLRAHAVASMIDEIVELPENRGNSASRNAGAASASGDIVAFTDDDAVPDAGWVAGLLAVYAQMDAVAVGGRVVPRWVEPAPAWFPDEFLWLVGCMRPGFARHLTEVRNTYGPNISFRRSVFEELGGFSTEVGRQGTKQIQAHETEIAARLAVDAGRGMVFTEDAIVEHKVYPYRMRLWWLLRRCFWQGYSKRLLAQVTPATLTTERSFLRELAQTAIPARLRAIARGQSAAAGQLLAIVGFTALIGLGYVYGLLRLAR